MSVEVVVTVVVVLRACALSLGCGSGGGSGDALARVGQSLVTCSRTFKTSTSREVYSGIWCREQFSFGHNRAWIYQSARCQRNRWLSG